MMTENQRLKAVFDYLRDSKRIKNQQHFTECIGSDKSTVSQVLNSRMSVPNKMFGDVISVFPEINEKWLLTGEGEMLKPNSLEGEGQVSKIKVEDKDSLSGIFVPLVPMAAMGGELMGFEDMGVRDEDCEKVISPVSGASFAVPIYGDSMEPEYPNGSRVFVKQINPADFIAWGNVYVLDTTNGIILKVVVKSDDPNALRCVSLNASGRYQPFDVPKRTIRGMYRVLACVTAKG